MPDKVDGCVSGPLELLSKLRMAGDDADDEPD